MSGFTVFTGQGQFRYTARFFFKIDQTGVLSVGEIVPNSKGGTESIVCAVFNKDYWTLVEYDDV